MDYILTHTGPSEVVAEMGYADLTEDETEFRRYLQRIADQVNFKEWYFGHFHEDAEIDGNFFCLMEDIIKL